MRTIKFRAWDNAVDNSMFYFPEPIPMALAWMRISQDPSGYEVMQFTGLLDKNGREIYEGDIVFHKGKSPREHFLKVVWGDYKWAFKHFKKGEHGGHPFRQLYNWPQNFEVIGNVYENSTILQ